VTGLFQQGATPTHTIHDEAALSPQPALCPHCGADCVTEERHLLAWPTSRVFACGHTVEDPDVRQYVDRALADGVERYAHRIFISDTELDDLAGSNPTGLAALFLRDTRRNLIVHEAEQIIADHWRALLARPRREVPPALHPTLARSTWKGIRLWPRPTR
jgi:hypothetical protein